jgi:hypothetical protein
MCEQLRVWPQVRRAELAKLTDAAPQSTEDFERLVLGSPDASQLWIRYMAFLLGMAEVAKARDVAERALKTIDYRCVPSRQCVPEDEDKLVCVTPKIGEQHNRQSTAQTSLCGTAPAVDDGRVLHKPICPCSLWTW